MRCDTCTTSAAFIHAALAKYPLEYAARVYVINLQTGTVKAIYANWDDESRRQLGGYELPIDPLLQQYVSNVGQVYRQNGNSLDLKLVARADGSVYWVRANGTTEELKDADPQLTGGRGPMTTMSGFAVNDALPNSAPIDMRGYQFPQPGFDNKYFAFPKSSYDLAFSSTTNVNNFVRDQTAGIKYGTASGVINGTVSASTSPAVTTPIASIGGGVTITNDLTSVITVYVPMKDGGFARVEYDKKTGDVKVVEIQDGLGHTLPTNHPNAESWLSHNSIDFPGTDGSAYNAFRDWTLRNDIPIVVNPGSPTPRLSCHGETGSGGAKVTCKWVY